MDTVYLYNLMDAIRQARNGRYFRPDLYGPEATAQPEQKIPHPSVKYPKRGQGLRKFLLEKSRPAVPVPSHSNALPLEVPLTEAQIEQMESNEKMKKHYAPLTNQLFNRSPIEYAKKKQDLQAQVKVVVVKVAVTPSAASSSFFVPRKRKHAA